MDEVAAHPSHASSSIEDGSPSLKRALGLPSAVSIVIGTVIGSGVFLVPSAMIRDVGSVHTLFIVWIVAGLLSLFGALTYAELAAALPEAGGEYVFLSAAYGRFWGFLYGWTQFWVAKSGSIATLAAGFYTYLTVFYPALGARLVILPWHIGPSGTLLEIHYGQLCAIALILLLAAINYTGVRSGGRLQVVITIIKMVLIAAVIVAGLLAPTGNWAHLAGRIPVATGISGFFAAMVSALWAYDGWNNVSMVSSEITFPQRNLPRSLIYGTVAVICTYLLINTGYFYALSASQVGESQRVAADMMAFLYGPVAGKAVSVAVLISIMAALNGSILSGSRVPFAMARDGLFFEPISQIHPRYRTPGSAIWALSGWSCIVVLSGWYDDLYNFVIFGSWILYGLTAFSVIVLRWKKPALDRPYRALGYPLVPVLFVGVALMLLASTLLSRPREALMGLILMASGAPFFHFWKKRRFKR